MRYVKTNDGIYELMPNIEQDYEMSFDHKTLEPAYYSINHEWVAKKDVIKQGDTIEELCDCFVIVCEESSLNRTFQKLEEARMAGSYFECNHEYYGAIWTDKGLIYVAKMNSKGELELL